MRKPFIFLLSIIICIWAWGLCLQAADLHANPPAADYAVIIDENIISIQDFDSAIDKALKNIEFVHFVEKGSKEWETIVIMTKKTVLNELINNKLLLVGAKERKIAVTPEDVNKKLSELQKGYLNKDGFFDEIEAIGVPLEQLKDTIYYQLLKNKMRKALVEELEITDHDMYDFFVNHPSFFINYKKRQVSQIIVPSKQKAQEITSFLNNGQDFSELAKKFSIDAETNEIGGDLGYINLNQLPDKAKLEMQNLKPGEISKILKINNEYYLFKAGEYLLLDKDKKKAIMDYLLVEKGEEILNKWLVQKKETAQISIHPTLKHYYEIAIDDIFVPTSDMIPSFSESILDG